MKLFKSEFYLNQNEATRAYLDKATIWSDTDLVGACIIGVAVGFLLGVFLV